MVHIQVPVGKTVIVPPAAVDSTTSPTTEPPSTEPPSKEQQAVSAAVAMNWFEETIDPKFLPQPLTPRTSVSRRIKTSRRYFVIS
jgi:hypothetical protein